MNVEIISSQLASAVVIENHYLHRRPPISFAFGLFNQLSVLCGVVTFGVPPSRHLQLSACPEMPDLVLELNRLWQADDCGVYESWFVSRALSLLPPRIIVSYADTSAGHLGYVYRACNFYYAGWTDMERRTPRFDYLPADPSTHTRDAFRNGYVEKRRRLPKVKYWIVTGDRRDRRRLEKLCGWPRMNWKTDPPPSALCLKELCFN